MELWIRSQDKKRVKFVRDLTVKGKKVIGHTLSMEISAPDQVTLGTYETGARAMAVLDSIQETVASSNGRAALFEMPKE